MAKAGRALHTRSAPSLQFPDSALCVLYRYRLDSEYHILFDLNAMAERRLRRLSVHVRERYDRRRSERGKKSIPSHLILHPLLPCS
jgi:hypothetical protein